MGKRVETKTVTTTTIYCDECLEDCTQHQSWFFCSQCGDSFHHDCRPMVEVVTGHNMTDEMCITCFQTPKTQC